MSSRKNKGARRGAPVVQQRRGPQAASKPRVKTNYADASKVSHHLRDLMGKKSGMHTAMGRRACDQWIDPQRAGVPVLNGAPMTWVLSAGQASLSDYTIPAAITPGTIRSGRHNVTVNIGSAGFGFFKCVSPLTGFTDIDDLTYSDVGYTNSTMPNSTITGVSSASSVPQGFAAGSDAKTSVYVLGMKFTVKANQEPIATRGGSVAVFNTNNIEASVGIPYADLISDPWVETYPSGVFTDNGCITVRSNPRGYVTCNNNIPSGNGFSTQGNQCGFWFNGASGDTFIVEIEYAVFYFGTGIPRAVAPMLSSAAFDCLSACVLSLQEEKIGLTQGESGKTIKKLLSHAEHHTIASTAQPVISAVWPVIKQAASTLGPELMRLVATML